MSSEKRSRSAAAPKKYGIVFAAFAMGLLVGGYDHCLSTWYHLHLYSALSNNGDHPSGGVVWDEGQNDALYYWERLKQSGHEDDAVRLCLRLRSDSDQYIRERALFMLGAKLGKSDVETIKTLGDELQNPSLSESQKRHIQDALAMIRSELIESFPTEIEGIHRTR